MEQLAKFPPLRWANRHPRLAGWLVLAAGMVTLLVIEARDVGLLPTQWIALIVATVLVAGLCVWIVSWDDDNDSENGSGEHPEHVTNPRIAQSQVDEAINRQS